MKHTALNIVRRASAAVAMLAASSLFLQGCTECNPAYVARVECSGTVKMVLDNKVNPTGTYKVKKSTTSQLPNTWAWIPVFKKNDPAYVGKFYTNHQYTQDPDWLRKNGKPKWLTDTFLLQLPYVNQTEVHGNDFLTITIPPKKARRLWIAYDMRAYHPTAPVGNRWKVPSWLSSNFEPVAGVKISSTNDYKLPGKPPKTNDVAYGLWRLSGMGAKLTNGVTLHLGGNNAPGAQWLPGAGIGDQYLVLVERTPDPTNPALPKRTLGTVPVEFEDDDRYCVDQAKLDAKLKDALKNDWIPKNATYKTAYDKGLVIVSGKLADCECIKECAGTKVPYPCTATTGCTASKLTAPLTGAGSPVNSWIRQSMGVIDVTASTAFIDVKRQGTGTMSLSGEVEFRVTVDNKLEVGQLNLFGSPITLSNGRAISDFSLGHEATFAADCATALPGQPFILCDQYTIPADGFPVSGYTKVDGHAFSARLNSTQPVTVSVGYGRQTFAITGNQLRGSVEVDGDRYEVTMTLNINGYFTNLAPVAQVAELQEFYECQDQSRAEVTLYSSSFDEATPGDVVSTSWYEHAGSCTETLLGTGDTLSVEFGFGVHEITLSVEDTQGISHSIDFAVEVRDSQIDHAEPPPDIWVPQQDRDGAHVCLGPAFASDICSGSVLVSKNAPDCDDFPVGMSLVEWRFDDQFGNVLYHDQKVFVVDHAYFPPPRSFVSASLPAVQTGQTVQLFHETQPQGLGMFVDEYVVVYGPDQFYASIDDSGGVHHHSFVARRTNWTVGAMPTADVVFSGVFSDQFTELGLYQIETTLVVPGGDPANPADILAHGTLLLELTS